MHARTHARSHYLAFRVFEHHRLSIDCIATSEVSVSLTLDSLQGVDIDEVRGGSSVRQCDKSCSKPVACGLAIHSTSILFMNGIIQVLADLSEYADVEMHSGRSIIALIANVAKSSDVLAQVFAILAHQDVQVEMLSQGASKVNISLIVKDEDLDRTLEALHEHFFGTTCDR